MIGAGGMDNYVQPGQEDMDSESLVRRLGSTRLEGFTIDRDHVEYEKARRVWNGLVDRHPAAIVRARSVADVQKTIRIAGEAGAALAIRCGGHSFPGYSTCDDGIILDLSSMREVVVEPAAQMADVAGGALLGDLDKASAAIGLVTPAGVVSHTGAGGLALGGGMGWLSRRFGLTIDNLLGADLVLADGRLIRVSAEEEPDLFWGIRGGGGNFGVVTNFRFRMHPLGPVVVGRWAYAAHDAASVLQRFRALAADAARELTTAFTLTSATLAITAFWSGSADRAESVVAPFGRLGRHTSGSMGATPFLALQTRSDEHFAWGRRYYAKGGFLRDFDENAIEAIAESIRSAPTPDSEVYVLQLGGAVADIAEEATPYAGRNAAYYWIVEPVWDHKSDDERCLAWGRESASRLASISLRGNYVNEQSEVGVASSAYGDEKYERLAKLKFRYDPANLFRLNQNIEAKAS